MVEAFGLRIPTSLEEACDPRRMGLIVYDMQRGVVSQLSNGSATVAKIKPVLEAARAHGYRIFFTRHMWLPKESSGVGQLRRSMIWQHTQAVDTLRPPFTPGSKDWEIVVELAPQANEIVVDKITMSCFEGTFLNNAFRDLGLQAFAIVGIALEVGIAPTVSHACDLNYIPIVVSDACGYRSEEAQKRALDSFKFTGEVMVTDSSSIQRLMSAWNPARAGDIRGAAAVLEGGSLHSN